MLNASLDIVYLYVEIVHHSSNIDCYFCEPRQASCIFVWFSIEAFVSVQILTLYW